MEQQSRPLDALNANRGKNVIVNLKNGLSYTGKLKAFDIHINVVLEEAQETKEGQVLKSLGTVFIRGDTITIISPA